MGAAADIAVNTQLLVTLWETTWRAPLTTPADAEHMTYKTTQDVIDEWVNRMLFTVENIRVEKLGKPLGDKTGGNPSLQSLESRYSGRSLQDAKDALAGVAAVWQGSDDVAPNGIAALVADDAELTQWLTAQLSASRGRLEDIADPLEETVLVEPEIIQRAQDALRTLQVVVQVDLAQALGVTIAFNDNDGD